jgi:hypothetical protein
MCGKSPTEIEEVTAGGRDLMLWLCHSDARQVSDLPGSRSNFAVYDREWPETE